MVKTLSNSSGRDPDARSSGLSCKRGWPERSPTQDSQPRCPAMLSVVCYGGVGVGLELEGRGVGVVEVGSVKLGGRAGSI